jgi:periplasmic protein CpxP/Spy
MKISKFTKWAAGIAAAVTIGSIAYAVDGAAPQQPSGPGRFAAKLAELGVTAQQKEQIHGILRQYLPSSGPKIKQLVDEKRALRDTIRATPVDEAAIRAQAAKVAAIEADLAVTRAYVSQQVRQVLTPEQLQKIQDMQANADSFVDAVLARVANQIAGQ